MTATATAAGSADNPPKQVSLTNNSGQAAVVIVPAAASSEGKTSFTPISGTCLDLLNSTAGTATVANGATASFVLDQFDTDANGQPQPATSYQLVVGSAETWNPLACLALTAVGPDGATAFTPQTVTAADVTSLADAALFCQTIAANPTADLAQQYQAVLASANTAANNAADGSANSAQKVLDAIDASLETFFKGTDRFKDVTYAGVMAVQQYYTEFPMAWAQFGSQTYYLYGTTGSGASTATIFVGTLAFAKPASLDPAKVNFGYDLVFSPASHPTDTTKTDVDATKAKTLVYSKGLFVDDPAAATPAIALAGVFLAKSVFTGVAADTDTVIALTGSVNGSASLGLDRPQNGANQSGSGFWDNLIDPQNAAQLITSIMTFAGALLMLTFIGQMLWQLVQWVRKSVANQRPVNDEALEQQQQQEDPPARQAIEDNVRRLSAGNQQAPANPAEANTAIQATFSLFDRNLKSIELTKLLQEQGAKLSALIRMSNTLTPAEIAQIDQIEAQYKAIATKMRTDSIADVAAQFNDLSTQITAVGAQCTTLSNAVSARISGAGNASHPANQENNNAEINRDIPNQQEKELLPNEETSVRGMNE